MPPRYEVASGEHGDSYIVIDLRRPYGDRTVARFYGDLKDALRNAEAFCFMKNMWQTG
jgi:hypothetical protein